MTQAADIFPFRSIHEFGGAVLLEAMALGVVPVVVSYGGPGELVTPDTGYLIPIADRAAIVRAFRDVLTDLCDDPSALKSRSRNGLQRVADQFIWQAKAGRLYEVSQQVLTNGRAR